jgi:hypothetical protein
VTTGREEPDALRQELERSRSSLFGGENPRLLAALRAAVPGLERAYVVDWIPEQGEDLYTVVVATDVLVEVELDRRAIAEPVVVVRSVREYRRQHPSLSKVWRRKLRLALDLIRSTD